MQNPHDRICNPADGWRQYDAALGRWNVQDPLAEGFSSYSPYNYVMNSPANYIDPNGMMPWSWQRNGETAVQYSMRMHNQDMYDMMYLGSVGIGGGGAMDKTKLSYLVQTGYIGTKYELYDYYIDYYSEPNGQGEKGGTRYLGSIWEPTNQGQSNEDDLIDIPALVQSGPDYIGGFAPAVGVGNAGQVVKAAQYVVSGAMAVALIKYFQENPVFGDSKTWVPSRGQPWTPSNYTPNNKNYFNTGPGVPNWLQWLIWRTGGAAAGKKLYDIMPQPDIPQPTPQPTTPVIYPTTQPIYNY